MNSEIYEHFQTIYRDQFGQVMNAIKTKLYETIMNLNSDEVLKSFNLDKSLEPFKLERIKQIVEESFSLAAALEDETAQLTKCKSECYQLKIALESKNEDHLAILQQVQKRFSEYKRQIQLERASFGGLHQKSNDQLEEINLYKLTIRSMQEDMLKIKTQWQKRCKQVEKQAIQQSNYLVEQARKDAQAKLDVWLEHISRQQGQLVIREDQKIIEQAKQQHLIQIKKIKQTHKQQLEQLQQSILYIKANQKKLKQQLKQLQNKSHDLTKSQQSKEHKLRQQNTLLKSQIDVIMGKNEQTIKDRLLIERKSAGEIQNLITKFTNSSQIIESKQQQISILKEKLLILESTINNLKQVKHKLSAEVSQKDSKNIELESRIVKDKQKQKRIKDKLRHAMMKIEGLRLQSNRLRNQHNIQKDQINYELSTFKRKINSLSQQVIGFIYLQNEKHEMKYNTKLNTIMYQFDLNQKNDNMALEQALKDNEYLRQQLQEYEQTFEAKLEELSRQKQSSRVDIEQQLQQLRITVIKMVKNRLHEKTQSYDRVRDEILRMQNIIHQLMQQKNELVSKNKQLISQSNRVQIQLNEIQKQKKMTERQLRQIKADLMIKDKMMQQNGKLNKQKQNVRSNVNRQHREKEMQQIRAMLVKTYEAVGSQPPEKHRRKI